MKLALIRLKKNNIASILSTGNGIQTTSMGFGLIKEGVAKIAKEFGISEDEAMNMVLETFMKN